MAGVLDRSFALFIILPEYEREYYFILFENANIILIVMIYWEIFKKYHLWIPLSQRKNATN